MTIKAALLTAKKLRKEGESVESFESCAESGGESRLESRAESFREPPAKTPRISLECEILLAKILQKPRVFLHANDDVVLPPEACEALFRQVARLNRGEPIEYITNEVGFFSQTFYIARGALIPRPESEILVEKASALISRFGIKKIFEIGVGSGVLSIVLCQIHRDLEVVATDISAAALEVARINIAQKSAQDPSLKSRIKLVKTNLLDGVERGKRGANCGAESLGGGAFGGINCGRENAVAAAKCGGKSEVGGKNYGRKMGENRDFIISNPPYIKNAYKIPPNLAHEPREALFGGENGTEILEQIIALDAAFLCCEIGHDQAHLAKSLKNYANVEFYRDLAGFTRGFVAWK